MILLDIEENVPTKINSNELMLVHLANFTDGSITPTTRYLCDIIGEMLDSSTFSDQQKIDITRTSSFYAELKEN